MFKKQIQKLLLSGLLALILFSFFPVLAPQKVQAETQPQGPSGPCVVYENDFSSSRLLVSQSTVQFNEKFDVYFEAIIPQTLVNQCNTNGKDDYAISIYAYNDDWGTTISSLLGAYNYNIAYKADFFNEGGQGGFRQKIKGLTLEYIFRGATVEGGGASLKLYAYWHRKDALPTNFEYIPSGGVSMQNVGTSPNPNPPKTDLPNITGVNFSDTIRDNNEEKVKADELSVIIKPDDGGKGLRKKYRVALTDTAITFGADKGPDAIYADWNGKRIAIDQYIGIPYDSKGTLTYDYTPKFIHVKMYFADGSKPWDPKSKCRKDSANYLIAENDDCKDIVYVNDAKGVESNPTKGTKGQLAGTFDPTMKSGIWSEFSSKTAEAGKPLGTKELYVVPIVWGLPAVGPINGYKRSYVLGKTAFEKITIEVFKTDEDIKKACKDDPAVTEKDKCDDLQYAKFGFGETVTQKSDSSETADKGASQSLYDFIVKVISQIVIWLTALIYKIFAQFVVPVLNALLAVRPYQDAFVNIIYPGWLILRNLANIFFIIALLVVGLRILFQQSQAGTARGFIMRLIIMALLVNFSLVIAQGIVGIADTVQSQFMPSSDEEGGGNKVIEALGSKLMVEPIQSFRTAVTGGETGEFKQDYTIADTAKPIVLLVLAIAAFFSFIAVGAFLAVRLVALMVLYMVSPIAYVGYVMEETKTYAASWWKEFLKYAFLTPILVFFLNMAAVVATVTSTQTGNVIHINDELSGDLVAGGLTIASHFLVLLFIFAGFKYATKSGAAGAKTITDYAKKGFDALTTRPAKALVTKGLPAIKDFAGDQAATGMGKLFGSRAENVTQALFKPFEAAKKLKKGAWDRPGEDRKKREEKRLGTIDDQAYNIMTNKAQAAKYAALTLMGKGPKRQLRNANALKDESDILTDDERRAQILEAATAAGNEAAGESELEGLNNGKLSVAKATELRDNARTDVSKLTARIASMRAQEAKLTRDGDVEGALEKRDEIAAAIAERTQKTTAERELDGAITAATAAGQTDFNMSSLPTGSIDVVFKVDDYKEELKKEIDDFKREKERLDGNIAEDNRRREEHGWDAWNGTTSRKMNDPAINPNERAELKAKSAELQASATKNLMPVTYAEREQRRSAEREQEKHIEDIDDAEELIEGFEKAVKTNNAPLATAIAKKMAKEGNFDQLLTKNGYENNVQSMQSFLEKTLSKLSPQARLQVGTEISTIADKNGNSALKKATKVDQGAMRWATMAEHSKAVNPKLEGSSPAKLADMSKNEMTYQAQGKYHMQRGLVKNLNSMDQRQLDEFTKRTAPAKLKHLSNTSNFSALNPNIQAYINRKVNP